MDMVRKNGRGECLQVAAPRDVFLDASLEDVKSLNA